MQSRETDLINLLLCGSVLQSRRRSGLEGITSLMGITLIILRNEPTIEVITLSTAPTNIATTLLKKQQSTPLLKLKY